MFLIALLGSPVPFKSYILVYLTLSFFPLSLSVSRFCSWCNCDCSLCFLAKCFFLQSCQVSDLLLIFFLNFLLYFSHIKLTFCFNTHPSPNFPFSVCLQGSILFCDINVIHPYPRGPLDDWTLLAVVCTNAPQLSLFLFSFSVHTIHSFFLPMHNNKQELLLLSWVCQFHSWHTLLSFPLLGLMAVMTHFRVQGQESVESNKY